MGLLETEPHMLGWTVPQITVDSIPIPLNSFLGSGSSALVFKGKYNGKNVVVKRFLPQQEYRLKSEKEILDTLKDLQPGVPTVLAVADDGVSLILTPIGRRFAARASEVAASQPAGRSFINYSTAPVRATVEHFEQILDTLAAAHNKGVVHCDMKLTNCFDVSHLPLKVLSTPPPQQPTEDKLVLTIYIYIYGSHRYLLWSMIGDMPRSSII